MISINNLKERNNALVDEMRRIEGAIRENNHLIAWIEKEESEIKVDSVEKIDTDNSLKI